MRLTIPTQTLDYPYAYTYTTRTRLNDLKKVK